MNKIILKRIFFILLVILSVFVFTIFIRNLIFHLEDLKNQKNFNKIEIEEKKPIDKYEVGGLNIEIGNYKFCRNDLDCLYTIFISCREGDGIFLDSTNSKAYNLMVRSLQKDVCNIVVKDFVDSKNNLNCLIPKKYLNKDGFNDILLNSKRISNKYCKKI